MLLSSWMNTGLGSILRRFTRAFKKENAGQLLSTLPSRKQQTCVAKARVVRRETQPQRGGAVLAQMSRKIPAINSPVFESKEAVGSSSKKNFRVPHQCTCNGHPLLLATAQLGSLRCFLLPFQEGPGTSPHSHGLARLVPPMSEESVHFRTP